MLPRKRFVALETSSYLFDMLYKFSPWLKYPRILPQKGNLSLLLLLNGKIIILRTMSLLLTWLFIIHKIIFLNKIMNLKLMNLNMIQILSLLLLTERIIILLTILLLFNSLSFPPGSLMRYACIVGAGEVVWVKMWQSYWLADGRVGFRVCVAEQR